MALPDRTLPARWGRRQRLKNTLIYHLIRFAGAFLQHLPQAAIRPTGYVLGQLAALVAGRDRRRARRQLAQAMPELSAAAQRRTVRRMFVHLARAALEVAHLPALLREPARLGMGTAQRRVFDEALAEGRGVVAVTGHLGNWELLAQLVAAAGYPVTTIAKPLYDPRLTHWVHRQRTAFGLGIIWRGAQSAAKDMLRVFRNRGILALLIDQDTRVEGTFVPFFGRPAYTPTAAASLALRFRAPVVMAWSERRGTGYAMHCERLHYVPTGDTDADVMALTAAMTAKLESAIRAAPDQWVWMHQRWKRQPVASIGEN